MGQATNSWSASPVGNPATLATPGSTATTWSFHLPVPAYGGSYLVTAPHTKGQVRPARRPDQSQFAVSEDDLGPEIVGNPVLRRRRTNRVRQRGRVLARTSQSPSVSGVPTLASIKAGATGNLAAHSVTLPAFAAFGESSLLATGPDFGQEGIGPHLHHQLVGRPRQ